MSVTATWLHFKLHERILTKQIYHPLPPPWIPSFGSLLLTRKQAGSTNGTSCFAFVNPSIDAIPMKHMATIWKSPHIPLCLSNAQHNGCHTIPMYMQEYDDALTQFGRLNNEVEWDGYYSKGDGRSLNSTSLDCCSNGICKALFLVIGENIIKNMSLRIPARKHGKVAGKERAMIMYSEMEEERRRKD